MNHSQKIAIILGSIFGVLGLGMLWGSWASFKTTQDFLKQSVSSVGTVIELKLEYSDDDDDDHDDGYVYYPIIEFRANNGEKYKFKGSLGSNTPPYQVGEEISVLYKPSNPEQASIDSFGSLWFLPIFLLAMGGTFSTVGIGCLLLMLKLKTLPKMESATFEFNEFKEDSTSLDMPFYSDNWPNESEDNGLTYSSNQVSSSSDEQ